MFKKEDPELLLLFVYFTSLCSSSSQRKALPCTYMFCLVLHITMIRSQKPGTETKQCHFLKLDLMLDFNKDVFNKLLLKLLKSKHILIFLIKKYSFDLKLNIPMFSSFVSSREVKVVSLEGCSVLTTEGLESVVLSWKELRRLRVVSCNNIKDSEITPALASLFSLLKELKWRPDSRSLLLSTLAGIGSRKKGGRFFKRLSLDFDYTGAAKYLGNTHTH